MANPIQRPNPDFLSEIKSYESCLGKGGFGVVLKAIDMAYATTAIKFIFLDTHDFSDRRKLFREYKVTKDLDQHPNIVKIINVQQKTLSLPEIEEIFNCSPSNDILKLGTLAKINERCAKTLDSFCIQMELCGDNLRKWLNEKHNGNDLHIKIRQTRIIQGMISGLKYLHENKIIHRDLKPENIMFTKGRYQLPVKIGDFGLCRRIHSEESETGSLTTSVGTASYMATEVYSGDYDHQADLYSLGLIIWEVSQLIEPSKRRHLFHKLVHIKVEELVEDHPIMKGIKEIIIGLTKSQTTEWIKTLDDIHIDIWDKELTTEVQSNRITILWESISNSAKNWTANTNQELKLCLDNALPGCIINLRDGEYQGPFVLRVDSVQIVGSGSGAVLRSDDSNCLIIVGSGCTISNVKIIESDCGIILLGSQNTIKEVEFNDMKLGIIINGSKNTVDNVTMINIEDIGISIFSDGNTISDITGLSMRWGIAVGGSNNNFTNINFQRGAGNRDSTGVSLDHGSPHSRISNLTCAGYSRDKGDWGLTSWEGSSDSVVVDSVCGPIRVRRCYDLTLRNVHCGEFIEVGQGVDLINCRGKKLLAPKTATISQCQFEKKSIFD